MPEIQGAFNYAVTRKREGLFEYTRETGQGVSFDPEKLAQIPEKDRRWAWVEVDLNAVRHNLAQVRRCIGPMRRLLAVVKANAYGHGAVRVAKTALNSGADYLAVGTVNEGIQLREALVNAPILVLSEPPASAIPLMLAYKLMPSVYSSEFAVRYGEAADSYGMRAPYHLVVNTGMNVTGVHHDEVLAFMRQVGFHRALELEGTYTQLATAESADVLDFQLQLRRFNEAVAALRGAGVDPGLVHCANSAAAVRYSNSHFDMVRVGTAMYGFYPCAETRMAVNLKPVMSVHARVTDVRALPMSEGVGEGLAYRSRGSVKTCTIPVGFADGYPRVASGKTDVIYAGQRVHQVGTIGMDHSVFEVNLRSMGLRARLDPQVGDEVVVMGCAGGAEVSATELARLAGTTEPEICIGFSHRMPLIYV